MVSDVYYEEVYYEAPSSIPYGDSKFFLCPTLLKINTKTSPYSSIRKLLWKKKKTVNVNTRVFDWLLFKKWCSELNEFLLSQKIKHRIIFICKSVTDQFSHQCLHKITEFNQTAKNLNCSHGSCLISDHKQLKQFSVGFVPAWTPILHHSSRKNSKNNSPALSPVTNWFQLTCISCPPHHSFTIHFLS